MIDHRRKIVHGRACVEISTQSVTQAAGISGANVDTKNVDMPTVDADGQIRAWHWCDK
jgi:hypothetical protein